MTELNPQVLLDKYQEAIFFFNHIVGYPGDFSRYYLSAFLSAVYTLDDYLKIDGYGFKTWANTTTQRKLHDHMIELRRQTTHLKRPSTSSQIRPPVGFSFGVNLGTEPRPERNREWETDMGVAHTDLVLPDLPKVVVEFVARQMELPEGMGPLHPDAREAFLQTTYGHAATVVCGMYCDMLADWLIEWNSRRAEGV